MAATDYISYKQAARLAKVSKRTIYRLVRKKQLTATGRGSGRKILQYSVGQYLFVDAVQAKTPEAFNGLVVDEQVRKAIKTFLQPYVQEIVSEESNARVNV